MPRDPLTVAVAQPACETLAVAENAEAHAEAIRRARARVVVFPELSLTGYELQAPALRADDTRLASIALACVETGTVALVGVPLQGEGGDRYIAVLAITDAGSTVAYRKVWLGAEEAKRFRPGPGTEFLEVDGWRLGLGICKDTGIAQHAAQTAALGIDAYVAGIVMNADELGEHDGRARRIACDHRVYVGFASFAGPAGGDYDDAAGCSSIWSPSGELITRAGPDAGEFVKATLV